MSRLEWERRRKRKWEDAFWGLIVGDAIGLPSEGKQPEQIAQSPVRGLSGHGAYDKPIGTWGQPTSLVWASLTGLHEVRNQRYHPYKVQTAVLDNLQAWVRFGRYTADGKPLFYSGGVPKRIKGWVFDQDKTISSGLYPAKAGEQGAYILDAEVRQETEYQQEFMSLPIMFSAALYSAADSPNGFHIVSTLYSLLGGDTEDEWAALFYVILLHELSHNDVAAAITNTEKRTKRLAEEYDLLPEQQEEGWGVNPVLARAYEDPNWSVGQVDSASELLAMALQVLIQFDTLDAGLRHIANQGGPSSTWGAVAGSLLGMAYGGESLSPLWDSYLAHKDLLQVAFNAGYDAFHEDSPFHASYGPQEPGSDRLVVEHL